MPILFAVSSSLLSCSALVAALALGRTAWRLQSEALWWAAGGVLAVGAASGLMALAVVLPSYDMAIMAFEAGAAVLFGITAWRLTCAGHTAVEVRTADPLLDEVAWAARVVDLASSTARPSWGRTLADAPVMLLAVDDAGQVVRVDGGLVGVKETARGDLTLEDVRPALAQAREVREVPLANGRLIVALGGAPC